MGFACHVLQPVPTSVLQFPPDGIHPSSRADLTRPAPGMQELWDMGYAPVDIITVVFRVARNHEPMAEYLKLEFIQVRALRGLAAGPMHPRPLRQPLADCRPMCHHQLICEPRHAALPTPQEIGKTHLKLLEGVDTLIQLTGLVAKLCRLTYKGELEQ